MNIFQEAKQILDKDGKVNALGPYGKGKLTGREVSTYFRRNKVKDAKIKKAVEVALDLGGAHSIATQEIRKFYGDKILKSKEVQSALQYANESRQPGMHVEIINEKFKPDNIKSRQTGKKLVAFDAYIQFRGGKGDRITSPENKKDWEKAIKLVQMWLRKHKIKRDINKMFSRPEEGSSAYILSISLNDKEFEKNPEAVDDLVNQISKLKTAEDHGGGHREHPLNMRNIKPNMNEDVMVNTKDPMVYFELQKIARKTGAKVKKVSGGVKVIGKNLDKSKGFLYQLDKLDIPGFNPNYESAQIDEGMKLAQIVRKHKAALMKAKRSGSLELPSKVEDDLQQWVFDNEPHITDDPDDFDQWLDDNIDDLVPTLKIKEETISEESISYQLKARNKNGPEYKKFEKSAKMMKLKMTSKINAGNKMVAGVSGTKKNLRDFDAVVRGHMSYGEPSTIKHFDESNLMDTYRQINLDMQEASAAGQIDKLFNLKGNKEAGYGVAKLLNMTGVKVAQAMQKQNPKGFMKTMIDMGAKGSKQLKLPTNKALMKMFKDQGVKPLPEGKLGDSIIRKDFPNVWAASAKDRKVLAKFHAKVDTTNYVKQKALYKKDIKGFVDSLNEDSLYEGTWAIPDSKDKLEKLNRALVRPIMIKTEKDLDKAAKIFAAVVGDDGVADAWYKMMLDYEDVKKVGDAREPVVKFLQDWGDKVNNFKITHAPGSWVSGMDDDERSSAKINEAEMQEGLFDKMMKKWKGKGKIKKKREKLVKIEESIYDVYREMNEQPLTGYGYRSTERDSNRDARVADWKKKKSEETKVEALQKKLEFARKQRQVHDDAASEYREKASKVRERNPDDRAADNYDMKADKQEDMAHNQNEKVRDLKDAIKKEKGIKDSYSPDPMSSIIQEFNINMPDKVKNQVIGLYNKAMDVKHNSPEHKSIKKEIGMIMKKYS